jgi:histidinol-phosphate aminotransferase
MALPSIRCGYCISNKDNIDMINAVKAPYSLSTFSQILAKNAISNFDLYKDKINEIKVERQRLFKELKDLGFIVFNSEANFIYVIMDEKYYDELLNNKIYIRRFDNLHYRITVGSQTENNMLLEVLRCAVQK